MKLINEKKSALAQDSKTGSTAQGRDLLTLLIKSNMASETEAYGMSDEEVMARKPILSQALQHRPDANIA